MPERPRRQPRTLAREGMAAPLGRWRTRAVQSWIRAATVGEKSTLTWEFPGIETNSTVGSGCEAARSAAFPTRLGNSYWPTRMRVLG